MDVTRIDVERAVHKARSLVTLKPLPDDMAVIAGPRGSKERPRGIRKIRGMVRRQRLDIAIGNLGLDGVTWRNKARMLHAVGRGCGLSMVDAICSELGIKEKEALDDH